jgi:hypothetical protein
VRCNRHKSIAQTYKTNDADNRWLPFDARFAVDFPFESRATAGFEIQILSIGEPHRKLRAFCLINSNGLALDAIID